MKTNAHYSIHEPTGFVRYLTNPDHREGERNATQHPTEELDRVRDYLHTVLVGDGERAFCPFVEGIEDRNGYYGLPIHDAVDPGKLACFVKQARQAFLAVSSMPTHASQAVDFTTTFVSFHHPDNCTPSFGQAMDHYRDGVRGQFLAQGLMVSQMHPFHARTERNGAAAYGAGVPCLMVRRMHRPDRVFMHTEEETELYAGFFGNTPEALQNELASVGPRFLRHTVFNVLSVDFLSQPENLGRFLTFMLRISHDSAAFYETRLDRVMNLEIRQILSEHLSEEHGHSDVLQNQVQDLFPGLQASEACGVLEALLQLSQQSDLAALLVSSSLEACAAAFYTTIAPRLKTAGVNIPHFQDHAVADATHAYLGHEYLRNLPEDSVEGHMTVVNQTLRIVTNFFDQVAKSLTR